MLTTFSKKLVRRACVSSQSARWHHPDPFNPKVTKGWKAAVKVGDSTYPKEYPFYVCLSFSAETGVKSTALFIYVICCLSFRFTHRFLLIFRSCRKPSYPGQNTTKKLLEDWSSVYLERAVSKTKQFQLSVGENYLISLESIPS